MNGVILVIKLGNLKQRKIHKEEEEYNKGETYK